MTLSSRPQYSIKREVSFRGIGLHGGKPVEMRLVPAPANTGVVFERDDLPSKPQIPAQARYVKECARSTTIGTDEAEVNTVEHLLAALFVCSIDNVIVHLTSDEVPIGDGSSQPFIELIEKAGKEQLEASVAIWHLQEPLYLTVGETVLVALPADRYQISYTLHYPQSKWIGSQYLSLEVTEETFKKELAPCRTFALYEEITYLKERGLIRGGSLESAVVIKEEGVLNEGGLRFKDEMVRHKMLDLIGDLALAGFPFIAHIVAVRSGHLTNTALAAKISKVRDGS